MKRSNFLKTLSASAVAAAIPNSILNSKTFIDEKIIKPKRLQKGDTIGLISPGSFITEKELRESVENIEKLGFRVVYTKNILAKDGYLAGTDEQRVNDIHEMFRREDVDGIICTRGGYGCARFLPMLDYDLIRNNPKPLIGYSDITSLLYGIFAKTGVVSFHGPVGISTFNDYSKDYFNSVLMFPENNLTFFNLEDEENKNDELYKTTTIKSGKANGILVGGNLSIVVSMLGTPYDVDTDGKIIFLEEISEEPYRIDRMLTQMIQAGKFDNAAGVAMGVFRKCEPKPDRSGIFNSFTLMEVLHDRFARFDFPVLYGMSFGHVKNKFTIPFGINAELDSVKQTLTLLEPAVL